MEESQKDEKKKHTMFMVTVKTKFEIKSNGISIDRDFSDKEVLEVIEKEISTEELEDLGVETKKFNDRQEYYAKDEFDTKGLSKGDIKFQFIASKDPRVEKPL